MIELIDTHCHLTFEELSGDVEAVIERSRDAGVTGWITVGTDTQQNRKAIELANKFENMYAAVGIHPHDAKNVTTATITELKKVAQKPADAPTDISYSLSKPGNVTAKANIDKTAI